MSINTHGLTMKGLWKASKRSGDLRGLFDNRYGQINYNSVTGCLWLDFISDPSRKKSVEYRNPYILNCAHIASFKTPQQIADLIYCFWKKL